MNFEVKYPLVVAAVYLWMGFVCAISFMEAWLKFRAPGVNLSIGLGIGRIVFQALNKVEWVFAIAIFLNLLADRESLFSFSNLYFFLPVLLLFAQTFWLLPMLDSRATLYIKKQEVPPSNLHLYFVGVEILKVLSLFLFSIKLFK